MQLPGAGHETPLSSGVLRLGVGSIVHWLPSHPSASDWMSVPAIVAVPTATQPAAGAHDTLASELCVAPSGSGGVRIVHCAPSHPSANMNSLPDESTALPTATHAVREEHEMPLSWLQEDPDGLGDVTSAQLIPFHCSTRVSLAPDLPTAVQLDAARQSIPNRTGPAPL